MVSSPTFLQKVLPAPRRPSPISHFSSPWTHCLWGSGTVRSGSLFAWPVGLTWVHLLIVFTCSTNSLACWAFYLTGCHATSLGATTRLTHPTGVIPLLQHPSSLGGVSPCPDTLHANSPSSKSLLVCFIGLFSSQTRV